MKYIIFLSLIFLSCSSIKKNSCKGHFDEFTSKCVFIFVEKMPSYNDKGLYDNGKKGLMRYFLKNFNYPKDLDVFFTKLSIQFIIDENGKLLGERISGKEMKNINPVEAEALRLIRTTQGSWTCGEHRGEAVAVLLTFTFRFVPRRGNTLELVIDTK